MREALSISNSHYKKKDIKYLISCIGTSILFLTTLFELKLSMEIAIQDILPVFKGIFMDSINLCQWYLNTYSVGLYLILLNCI